MMTERKKLSLGKAGAEDAPVALEDRLRAWNISPKRMEALKQDARFNRRNPSEAQKVLWGRLRDKMCAGFTFNREVLVGSSIVDFVCKSRWLVVETGDEGEAEAARAALSDRKLTEIGMRVLRFTDVQVIEDPDAVVEAIKTEVLKPFERPVLPVNTPPAEGESERNYAEN